MWNQPKLDLSEVSWTVKVTSFGFVPITNHWREEKRLLIDRGIQEADYSTN
jgi:hypothetical protein